MILENETKYYVSAFFWKNYNAASKAKMDIEEIFQRLGFESIDFFKDWRNIRLLSITKLLKLLFVSLLSKKYACSDVFFQNGTGIDLFLAPVLRFMFRRGKRIIVIHDIETIRFARKIDLIREKFVFSNFTHAVCHSQRMAEFLKRQLGFKGEVFVLEFFDYLLGNDEADLNNFQIRRTLFPKDKDEKFLIVYAGNLSEWKSGFLHKIAKEKVTFRKYRLVLYGKGFDVKKLNESLEFKGVFPPDRLPYELQGHFGLIWDGDDFNEVSGNVGKYLMYNYPHKASLYIVSGLPIICWEGAALFEIVKKYNIGFGINSLKELDHKLDSISEYDYNVWKSNVLKLRDRLRKGKSMEDIIKQICGINSDSA